MDSFERVPEEVQWSEGMLLAPQHLQQSDIYWHALRRHQMAQLQPHYWGLLDVAFDEAAARAGKIRVTELHAVMPDGLVVQYPAPGQEETLVLDLAADPAAREQKPVTVHLAVPVRAPGAASRASAIQRYDSVSGTLDPDENTGEGSVEVSRLRPRLSLIAGEQVPAKYVSMPLVQVRRDIGGHFDFTEYHPPLLRLEASRFLGDAALAVQLPALAARIRAKAKELLGVVADTDAAPASANAYQRQVVHRLVAALPAFEVQVRTGAAHPFALYLALADLVGHIAGVHGDQVPMLFDPYHHNDAAPGFFKALRYLTSVLSKLSAAYTVVAFDREQDDLYTCRLAAGMRTDRLIVELKPAAGQSAAAAAQWLQQACIGAADMIPLLRRRRLTGARVRPLAPEQAAALGVPGGALYEIVNQVVEHDDKLVPVMRAGAVLHVQGAGGTAPPAAIVLYMPNRPAAPAAAHRAAANE